jgi:23S rRNA pseudouridine1911/1915/1917 synthase
VNSDELTFLYDDDDIFVVQKPARIHSVRITKGGASLAELLLSHNPALSSASPNSGDAGLVQRLDFETSGLLLGAKNRTSWNVLYGALQAGQVQKTYIALVEGAIEKECAVSSFIGSPYRRPKKMRVYTTAPRSPVRALWGSTLLSPLHPFKTVGQIVLATASPARRHQIRLHCASIGHPLVGDSLYGAKSALPNDLQKQRAFFLHAESVSFIRPNGEAVTVHSPYQAFLEQPA